MEQLISLENLIEAAKNKGIDFGKGDPYNRLRYYTKIAWLPHMVRKKDSSGNTRGHYPLWAVERLIEIESLKASGISNEEISKKLKVKTRFQSIIEALNTVETRNQAIMYTSFIILLLILANEFGIIRFGNPKPNVSAYNSVLIDNNGPKQMIENGTAFVPKNQNKLFIQTPLIKSNYKVYVTFTQDYSPAARYWVADIQDYKGFQLELDAPVFNNTEFNWWITN